MDSALGRGEAPTLAALADAVVTCAQAAGHERLALVGNSFGAQVVVEAALRHPERVESIVLLGPTVDPAARSLVVQAIRWLRNAPDELKQYSAFDYVIINDAINRASSQLASIIDAERARCMRQEGLVRTVIQKFKSNSMES